MLSWEDFKELSDFSAHPMTDEEIQYLCSEESLDQSRRLGEKGILLPHHIRIADLYELIYFCETISKNEKVYLDIQNTWGTLSRDEFREVVLYIKIFQLYRSHNYLYYFDLKSRVVNYFQKRNNCKAAYFDQCCSAFEKELFYPCICGLLSILEGMLGDVTGLSSPSIKKLFEDLIKREETKGTHKFEIANIQGFIEYLTLSSDFKKEGNSKWLNRHWILHGRSTRDIGEFDCLKLFNTIDAIIDVINLART